MEPFVKELSVFLWNIMILFALLTVGYGYIEML